MDVAYDIDRPHQVDGSPKVAFNPYLEARNCLELHGLPCKGGVPTAGRFTRA